MTLKFILFFIFFTTANLVAKDIYSYSPNKTAWLVNYGINYSELGDLSPNYIKGFSGNLSFGRVHQQDYIDFKYHADLYFGPFTRMDNNQKTDFNGFGFQSTITVYPKKQKSNTHYFGISTGFLFSYLRGTSQDYSSFEEFREEKHLNPTIVNAYKLRNYQIAIPLGLSYKYKTKNQNSRSPLTTLQAMSLTTNVSFPLITAYKANFKKQYKPYDYVNITERGKILGPTISLQFSTIFGS